MRCCVRRTVFAFLAGWSALSSPVFAEATRLSFESGGHKISVERFRFESRNGPAVVVLHGAGGPLLDGPEMRRMAAHLAAAGHTVYLFHYFDRTGNWFAGDALMQKEFPVWLATVRDGIRWIAAEERNSTPLGIYGYSLGGFLAVAAASNNRNVGAVVEHAGGIWNNNKALLGKMPPVLLVHGRRDQRVPFAKYAEPLAAILRNGGSVVQTAYDANEGHGFTQPASEEVRRKAAAFFKRYLLR